MKKKDKPHPILYLKDMEKLKRRMNENDPANTYCEGKADAYEEIREYLLDIVACVKCLKKHRGLI